jgi:hypothetical protein
MKRGRGRPSNEALNYLHDTLGAWWEEFSPKKWYPKFDKIGNDVVAADDMARLFYWVADAFDRKNSAANCNAAVDNARLRRRSSNSKANRARLNRKHVLTHKAAKKIKNAE